MQLRFHSLHHTKFRTNYSLFMPFYDYIYNTMDKSSDALYEKSLKGKEETVEVVHLTHLTSLQSIYHMRPGFAEYASKPYTSKWYMRMMWPVSWLSMVLTWTYGSSFTVERNVMKKLKMQSWAIPRYSFHVMIVFNSQHLFPPYNVQYSWCLLILTKSYCLRKESNKIANFHCSAVWIDLGEGSNQ